MERWRNKNGKKSRRATGGETNGREREREKSEKKTNEGWKNELKGEETFTLY